MQIVAKVITVPLPQVIEAPPVKRKPDDGHCPIDGTKLIVATAQTPLPGASTVKGPAKHPRYTYQSCEHCSYFYCEP